MSSSQQSPINLSDPIHADLGDKGLEIDWEGVIPGRIVRDDHGLKVVFAPNFRQHIRLGGKVYHLDSFHFHHPSEHWVEGKQHAVELHVVHRNIDDGTLAVVGIFIEAGEPKSERPDLMRQLKAFIEGLADENAGEKVLADPSRFLPGHQKEYYRYEGSLTTPGFTENVSWAVLRRPFVMSIDDLRSLTADFVEPARFPQPLNRRFVLATFPPRGSDEETASETKGRKSKGKA